MASLIYLLLLILVAILFAVALLVVFLLFVRPAETGASDPAWMVCPFCGADVLRFWYPLHRHRHREPPSDARQATGSATTHVDSEPLEAASAEVDRAGRRLSSGTREHRAVEGSRVAASGAESTPSAATPRWSTKRWTPRDRTD